MKIKARVLVTPSLCNQVKKMEISASFLDFVEFLYIKYASKGVNGNPETTL